MQKHGENMREENGGNINRSCFVRRKFLWKKRGERKRKFVVIIWERRENREERREIRAVFAPRQAVYSSKLYLVFPEPVTLPCSLPSTLCTSHAYSLHFVHASGKLSQLLLFHPPANQSSNLSPALSQSNQSYFTVWQSFILQFGRVKIINHTFT